MTADGIHVLAGGKSDNTIIGLSCSERHCKLESLESSMHYDRRLNCSGEYFYPFNYSAKAGRAVKSSDGPIVTMGRLSARLKWSMKMREKPSKQARQLSFASFDEAAYKQVTLEALPEGQSVLLLARTAGKSRVDQWTDYWYYAHVALGPNLDRPRSTGWIFGAGVVLPK